MYQNDPKMIYVISTYQTPPCLNCCLSLSNAKTKNYTKSSQDGHRYLFNGKVDPKLAQKDTKSSSK